MMLPTIRFSSGHKCLDNGVGDYDFFCPESPRAALFFLPVMSAMVIQCSQRCPLCGKQAGDRIEEAAK